MLPELTRSDVFRLETRRLWLRWPVSADEAAVADFASREEVAMMTATWPHPLPAGETARRIARIRDSNSAGRALTLALTRKALPTQAIGMIGGGPDENNPGAFEIGYMLAPSTWRQGIMTEAVTAYARMIFWLTGARQIAATARTDNPASRRVLEKAGFNRHASLSLDMAARGGAIPVDQFLLVRPASPARRAAEHTERK